MPHYGSSSKGKQRAHGSSSQQRSHQGTSHQESSQKSTSERRTIARDARNWDWVMEGDIPIDLTTNKFLGELAQSLHHVDFQLSRAWICFIQENLIGGLGTNHVYLRFDIKACDTHPWRGVKLEAQDDQDEMEEMDNPDSESKNKYDTAKLALGLRDISWQPRGLKFEVELTMSSSRILTLGDLFNLLLQGGLTSFGFTTKETDDGPALVGCRDYV